MTDDLSRSLSDLADEAPVRLQRPVTVSGLRAKRRAARWTGAATGLLAVAGTAAAIGVLAPDGEDVLQQDVAAPAPPAPTATAAPYSPAAASTAVVATEVKAPPPARLAETDEFGRITDIASDGTTLRVERVDVLSGQEAEEAAAADDARLSDGSYLRWRPEIWTKYTVDPDVVVWGSIRTGGSVQPVPVELARLVRFIDTEDAHDLQTLFHLDVEDGRVVGIEEQYRPS